MGLAISQRAARTVQSEIRVMSLECEKIKGINLAQGVCDTPVPEVVREGARLAMEQGINSYTRAEGSGAGSQGHRRKDGALQWHPSATPKLKSLFIPDRLARFILPAWRCLIRAMSSSSLSLFTDIT